MQHKAPKVDYKNCSEGAALSENKVTRYDADHTGLYKLEIYFAFTELNN